VFFAALCDFFYITEKRQKNFVKYPTQRHRDHREKTEKLCATLCSLRLCVIFLYHREKTEKFCEISHTEITEKRQKNFVPLCVLCGSV